MKLHTSRKLVFSPYILALLALFFFVSIYQVEDLYYLYSLKDLEYIPENRLISSFGKEPIRESASKCDVFSGKWVHDYSRPLYEEDECPYIIPQLTCLEHGRPDKDYQHWRWQPSECSLPSFDATLMLETLRGKTMLFVGDSLNRGQFISMVCLLHRLIPDNAKSMEARFNSLSVFVAKDYNATIGFYWSPFLLESNADDPTNHKSVGSVVRNNSINVHGKHWKEADIIVFNTYLWWMSDLKMLKGSFKDQVKEMVAIQRDDAYRMGMSNLVQWINENVDPHKTRVFFRTASPAHKSSENWGGKPHGNCYNETTMLENVTNSGIVDSMMQIIAEELEKSKVPIILLNITRLSYIRKDAHTSIYKKQWRKLTDEQLKNPSSYADCMHWCLPGVQDVWNELLFTKLFYT